MVKALALAMAASGAESDGSDDSERYKSHNLRCQLKVHDEVSKYFA